MDSFNMVAATATGCYQFKINHSKTKDMGIGRWITSPKFRVHRHEWAIMYYPQGCEKDNNGKYVSIFLEKQRESVNVRATFEFALLNKNGSLSSIARKETSHTFPQREANWGFSEFFERTKLDETYVQDCYFVLHVKITVKDKSFTRACCNASSVGFPREHFQKLREEKKHTDVAFDVNGEIFVAHRLIMAAHSPVFEAELFGSMAESNRDCITISEMIPSVFKVMIDFMYNGSLTINEELVDCEGSMSSTVFLQHLLAASDRYAMEKLKTLCEYELAESISSDTVLSTLELAEKHNCTELKQHCLIFIVDKNNWVSLLFTQGYIKLMQTYPSLLDELKDLAAENEI